MNEFDFARWTAEFLGCQSDSLLDADIEGYDDAPEEFCPCARCNS